jgi:uncharacterized protein with HEPN domain
MTFERERLKTYLSISDKHLLRLKSSLKALNTIIPVNAERYETLTEQEISYIDQMSYRFGKLQDIMGRLLRVTLIILGEDIENAPFIDVLNRAEKLGIIDDAQEWMTLRELRNILTHEYSDDENEIVNGINKLFEISKRICEIHEKIKIYIQKRNLI